MDREPVIGAVIIGRNEGDRLGLCLVSVSAQVPHIVYVDSGYPPGSVERARMVARINFVLTELEAPIWLMARHGFVLPKDMRVSGLRPMCEADFAFGEAKFARLLQDAPFFAGDSLTLADIIAGQIASWARAAKISLQPATAAYLARMEARPAWQRAWGE